jgi:hypothetical protein
MEALEKTLAGMYTVITRQMEKMKERNKAIKWLEKGVNKMQTLLK